jgi:putative DNA primase/helicase
MKTEVTTETHEATARLNVETLPANGQTPHAKPNDPPDSNLLLPIRSPLKLARVEPWPHPVDGSLLLAELAATLRRFVVTPRWAPETLALWILHTYAFQLRDLTTYIGLESPEHRCGKTTLVTVLSELANRAVVASNVSSPAFFRVIEDLQPTLLIDEADTFLQGNEELRGILNSGYTRETAYVLRVAYQSGTGSERRRGPDFDPAAAPAPDQRTGDTAARQLGRPVLASFSCWCPKVIARIGRLPDTLADRCILFRMQRKAKKDQCERLRNLKAPASRLRRQCARFVQDHAQAIAQAEPETPLELNDRAADIWEPLLALADLAGGDWPKLAREAALGLAADVEDNNPIGALLLDIFILFMQLKTERIFSRDLVDALSRLPERAWAEDLKGKEVTESWLAGRLRPYGLRPKTIWIGDDSAKGYLAADFNEAFPRYVTRAQVQALVGDPRQPEPPVAGTPPPDTAATAGQVPSGTP